MAMFKKMLVAGVGLIGGSLALDMRRLGLAREIVGYGRSEKNLRIAMRKGIIDGYFSRPADIPAGVDFLMMGTPVQSIVPLTQEFLPGLEAGCIVSDVGSVKAEIVKGMERILPPHIYFIGAHPIAGSEQWGAAAACENLFLRRRCILTPTKTTHRDALRKMTALWRRVGAKIEVMNAERHDRVLGVVSHLPHVAAFALVNALGETRVEGVDLKTYCAGGFKDITRIASSRPELWRDICLLNRKAVSRSLGNYIRKLERMKRCIERGDGRALESDFARANEIRERMG